MAYASLTVCTLHYSGTDDGVLGECSHVLVRHFYLYALARRLSVVK